MPSIGLKQGSHVIAKRGLINFGGNEYNPEVNGNENIVKIGTDPLHLDQETLLRKGTHEIGRVLKAGGDLLTAPVKWLSHMQENWLTYLICITIILVCILTMYCIVRRKLATMDVSSNKFKRLGRTTLKEIEHVGHDESA